MATTKANTNNRTCQRDRSFGIVALVCILALCTAFAWSTYTTFAYAKDINEKNEDQYNAVKLVATGAAPKLPDYSSSAAGNDSNLVDGATDDTWKQGLTYTNGYSAPIDYVDVHNGVVFRGGNARSSIMNITDKDYKPLDNDPDDFASVLPYGTVYIDTSKLSFGENNKDENNQPNFIIDINDTENFAWVADKNSYQALDKDGKTIISPDIIADNYRAGRNFLNNIAYIGGLKPYLSASKDASGNYTPNAEYVNCLAPAADGSKNWTEEPQQTTSYQYLNTPLADGEEGYVKKIEAAKGDYLYRFTFLNAATLPDGTIGNLVITTTAMEMEGSIDVPKGAPIGIHAANAIGVNPTYYPVNNDGSLFDSAPDKVTYTKGATAYDVPLRDATTDYGTVITSNDPTVKLGDNVNSKAGRQSIESVKAYIPFTVDVDTTIGTKKVKAAFGLKLTFDIVVTDKNGNPIDGTISYSATDLDVASRQALWGRRIDTNDADNNTKYDESLTINSGSLSYAVVPNYDHGNAATPNAGKIIAPKDTSKPVTNNDSERYDTPLNITGGTGTNADGVRFATSSSTNWRDKNGTFNLSWNAPGNKLSDSIAITQDRLWKNGSRNTAPGAGNAIVNKEQYNANIQLIQSLNSDYKFYERADARSKFKDNTLLAGVYGSVKTDYLTVWDIVEQTGSYNASPGNGNTFDTGFAVLLDSKGTNMTWTGSNPTDGVMSTRLFDTSMFTRVEQSHGTGGGTYLEGYDYEQTVAKTAIAADPVQYIKAVRNEGSVTMGRGVNTTVTAVPEDGYRVNKITISGEGIKAPIEFTLNYDATTGKVTSIQGSGVNTPQLDNDGRVKATIQSLDSNGNTINEGITFQVNQESDASKVAKTGYGTVDITFENIQQSRHTHTDFTTDYYFYKVWKNPDSSSPQTIPDTLELKATPFTFEMKEVVVGSEKYDISDEGTKYTDSKGNVYELSLNYSLTLPDPNDSSKTKTYYLVGDKLANNSDLSSANEIHDIKTEIKSGTSKTFTVDKNDTEHVTVLTGNNSGKQGLGNDITDSDEVWLIKYPAVGVSNNFNNWQELPIETNPNGSHDRNHVQRYYWFVTETAPPGWSMVDYDNSGALAPGVVTATDTIKNELTNAENSFWYEQSVAYHSATAALIVSQEANDHAFMSPLSREVNQEDDGTTSYTGWGGRITNFPSIIIEAKKVWENDADDAFKTRQDVLFHLDAKIGSETIEDYLPPIKIAKGATTDDKLKGAWGSKSPYDTEDPDHVKILSSVDDIVYNKNGTEISYKPIDGKPGYEGSDGNKYYINELPTYDKNGSKIEYSIRETSVVKKTNSDGSVSYESLIGYELQKVNDKDFGAWDNMATTNTTGTNGEKLITKTGTATNKLQVIDFSVTKIWDENGATGTNRTHTSDADKTRDTAALKTAYTLSENGTATTIEALKPSQATAYDATAETGTLEITSGTKDGKPTTTFTWRSIPKYAATYDREGNLIESHEAVYSITETTINGYAAPTYGGDATDKALNNGTITNKPTPPKGTDKTTYGAKGQSQTSPDVNDMFSVTTATTTDGTNNTIDTIKLVDPDTGSPTDNKTVNAVDEDGTVVGTYTLDNGTITFKPSAGFVGDPKPLQISATDSNGLSTTAEYQPHVVDNEKTVTRTIVYTYICKDGKEAATTVKQEVKFTGTVNPDDGTVSFDANETKQWSAVNSPDKETDGYTNDHNTVEAKTVRHDDADETVYVIYSPKGVTATPAETYGLPSEPQTGKPEFEMETPKDTDGNNNELALKLLDPNDLDEEGNPKEKDSVTITGEGTYTLNTDGTVTFTPYDGTEGAFVGNPTPIQVRGTDKNGKSATTTYQPHVVNPSDSSTATRTVSYTYETEDGSEVSDSVTQTVTLTKYAKSVDPKTGDVLEWGDWIPVKFPALTNPDDKVDIKVWTADSAAGEQEVSEPGEAPAVHVVYKKEPYTVTYLDGEHGTSNHAGDQTGEEYGSDVSGGNGVTPDKGYHFTGKYSYVIKDKFGNVIDEGETDDPTSIEITGNIEFTPLYEANNYTLKYDANGGSGTMEPQSFSGADDTATSKTNEFTREGYDFTGFKAKLPDGSFLKDEDGNDLVFASAEDFIEYLHELGDGAEIVLVAQWEPVEAPAPTPEPNPEPSPSPEPGPEPEPEPDQDPTPAPGKTPAPTAATSAAATPRATSSTGDEAPVAVLGLLALVALAGAGIAVRRSGT